MKCYGDYVKGAGGGGKEAGKANKPFFKANSLEGHLPNDRRREWPFTEYTKNVNIFKYVVNLFRCILLSTYKSTILLSPIHSLHLRKFCAH